MTISKFNIICVFATLSILASSQTTLAGDLDVPIIEKGTTADLPTCFTSVVAGLRADGDGFLAVRSGPGTQFGKIGEIYNGDVVFVFDGQGPWAGVMYGNASPTCDAKRDRLVPYPGKKGWVYTNWLKPLAG